MSATESAVIFDLEKRGERAALSATPEMLLRNAEGLVVIDEIQRMPELFEVLRPICDARDRKAVFLVLGSASLDLIEGVSETLAGHVQFVDVGGFSLAEAGPENQDRLWMRGGFPRAYLAPSSGAWSRWMESFTRTFLERDIPGLGSRVSSAALGRCWSTESGRRTSTEPSGGRSWTFCSCGGDGAGASSSSARRRPGPRSRCTS